MLMSHFFSKSKWPEAISGLHGGDFSEKFETPHIFKFPTSVWNPIYTRIFILRNSVQWKWKFNHLTPNGHFSGRTAPLTSRRCIYIFIQQIYVLNILNMLHTLRFFLFKMPFIS
jgi:hypothetical protein